VKKFFGLIVLLIIASGAGATPVIDVGTHALPGDTPDQQIALLVSGGDLVAGLNLLLQIGDGGSALGGVDGSAPRIQDISITVGTLFADNNTGRVFDDPATNQLWEIHTTTSSGTVSASGIVALLTLDTTGFMSGTYPLLLSNIGGDPNADTDFAGIPITILNGSITVPEPACMLVPLGLYLLRPRHRRHRYARTFCAKP
jgi:hypothetical protein